MKKIILFLILVLIPFNVKGYNTSAQSIVLMDMDNLNIIYSNDMNSIRSVASISKIMTAITAIEEANVDDKIIVGEEILDAYGSGVYIKQGEELKLEDLLYALMLRSGNDAALAIAKYVGGDVQTFVEMMNKKAQEIGMKNTTFNNPHGLDENGGNLSTAYDMAILTSYAMKNDEYKKIVSTKNYKLQTNMNYYSWTNKNKLLFSYKYITGGKTGYTDIARRTLVTTASKDNINLVVVTLNDGNDFLDHVNLFKEAFDNYTSYEILKSGNVKILNEKYYSNDNLYIKNSYSYSFANNEENSVLLKYKLEKKRNYNNDDVVGVVEIMVNDKVVHEEKIYVSKKETKGFFEKLKAWFIR